MTPNGVPHSVLSMLMKPERQDEAGKTKIVEKSSQKSCVSEGGYLVGMLVFLFAAV